MLASMSLDIKQARILIIDDQASNLSLLEDVLHQAGFPHLLTETDSSKAVAHLLAFQPDLVMLDLLMPNLDGFMVMEMLRPYIPATAFLPIVVLTADITRAAKRRALANGARDFLTKPIDTVEVILRIQNLLETRFLHLALERHNQRLQEEVRARTIELEESRIEMLQRLARAVEYRDDETGEHTHRVGETAVRIARYLGLSEADIELLRLAAPLHDLGKIGISDMVLRKNGPLSNEEYQRMRTHTNIGGELLANGHSRLIQMAEQIALTHHERWDGTGYPLGLRGDQIPLVGRIVAVADVFDALTHYRPYKHAWTVPDAINEIRDQAGKQFDPQVVEAFLQIEPVL
jgi:putative two-component system response regulator